VLEAGNNLSGPIRYVPVPIVTVPEPRNPPLPPVPDIPQAPQSNMYINAFTPPKPPPGMVQVPTQVAMQQRPPMMYGQPPMMYGQPPVGYPMHQAMHPQYPMPHGAPMMPPNYPVSGGVAPRTYQGPMPPNPMQQAPMMQPAYAPAQPAHGLQLASYSNPAMDRRGATPAVDQSAKDQVRQMASVLQTSMYPAQREWAANNLATFDCHAYPEVVQALLTAAKTDMAPSVRAACVYGLGKMKAQTEPVVAALHHLRGDSDQRVRQEVERALAKLAPATRPGVQPVRGY
jgi:hypothetical protein